MERHRLELASVYLWLMCVHVHVCASTGVFMRRSEVSIIFFSHAPPYLLRHSLQTWSLPIQQVRLVHEPWGSGGGILPVSASQPQHYTYRYTPPHLAFYMGGGDPNSSPHACVTSTLLIEPALSPWR